MWVSDWCHVTMSRGRRALPVGVTLLVVSGVLSAQAPSGPPVLDHFSVPERHITGHVLGSPGELAVPSSVDWLNGKLVVIDRKASEVIVVLDANSGRILRRFGRHGAGPGEFTGAWTVLIRDRAEESFWIFDTSLRRVTHVNLRTDFQRGSFVPSGIVRLEGGQELTTPQWIASGDLVSTGLLAKGLLLRMDSTGGRPTPIGTFAFGDPRMPAAVRQQGYDLHLSVDSSLRRLILVSPLSDRLQVLDVAGRTEVSAQRPFGFDPVFRVAGKYGLDAALTKATRNGYLSVEPTSSHLFVLYSGRLEGVYQGDAGYGRHVLVFNWSGRLLTVLALDVDALDIAVSPDERTLFAVRHDPFPAILAYPLPSEVRGMRRRCSSRYKYLVGSSVESSAADFLRTAEFPKRLYDNSRIVLDSRPLALMSDGRESVRPEARPERPEWATELQGVASRAGIAIATADDMIRCTHGVYGCTPEGVVHVQFGEPLVLGDGAYLLCRITRLSGSGVSAGLRDSRLLLTLRRAPSGWLPAELRIADGEPLEKVEAAKGTIHPWEDTHQEGPARRDCSHSRSSPCSVIFRASSRERRLIVTN